MKWFWAWQDEVEEAWLRDMSNQGWYFSGMSMPTIYNFKHGEAKDYAYRLDYRSYWKLENYTDAESKIGKYQRLLAFLGILMLPLFIGLINMRDLPYGGMSVIQVFVLLIFLLYVYAMVKLFIRINQLKRL